MNDTAPEPVASPPSAAEMKATYLQAVAQLAADGDVYPIPFMAWDADGSLTYTMAALDADALVRIVAKHVRENPSTLAVAYGLDRTTRPNQGTTLGNVFTWTLAVGDDVTHGIVEYDAGNVLPAREDNGFWNEQMRNLWRRYIATAWIARG